MNTKMPARSIPARAGEPAHWNLWRRHSEVYPRACGGTAQVDDQLPRLLGLSPRVRGNRGRAPKQPILAGSIPARAGEPSTIPSWVSISPVYPRACGGTAQVDDQLPRLLGLSPRVRGNPRSARARSRTSGSIPARAGEPGSHPTSCRSARVYPRACGGTMPSRSGLADLPGLSPRVRGNHYPPVRIVVSVRSIPARAGEPYRRSTRCRPPGVYLRACGGTPQSIGGGPLGYGLSPRVRGNRRSEGGIPWHEGSIPARAGEPGLGDGGVDLLQVYPRACGGTVVDQKKRFNHYGLSPRVRGNRRFVGLSFLFLRSIPARAGEP